MYKNIKNNTGHAVGFCHGDDEMTKDEGDDDGADGGCGDGDNDDGDNGL